MVAERQDISAGVKQYSRAQSFADELSKAAQTTKIRFANCSRGLDFDRHQLMSPVFEDHVYFMPCAGAKVELKFCVVVATVTAGRTPHGAGLPESALYAYAQKIHE